MKRTLFGVLSFVFCLWYVVIGASAQKPGTVPTVNLRVNIESVDSSNVTSQIQSDGLGLYENGTKGISAFFNSDGELIFRIDPKTSTRRVWFDYSSPYDGIDVQPPTTPNSPLSGFYADSTSLLTTVAVRRDGTYVPLQSLRVNPLLGPTTECVQLQWGYTDAAKTFWSHNFHRPQSATSSIDVSQTSYGVVTCTAADANGNCVMWEVEPKADNASLQCESNGSVPGLARLIDRPVRSERNNSGLYLMPFKLTLTRK